jgi:hypothetical protein
MIPVETGIQVLSWNSKKFNLDARVREHDASQVICASSIRRRRIDVNIP